MVIKLRLPRAKVAFYARNWLFFYEMVETFVADEMHENSSRSYLLFKFYLHVPAEAAK